MHWRRRAGLGVVALIVAIPAAVVGVPLAARGAVRAIVLILNACVWVAVSISSGVSPWTMIAVALRTTTAALATPKASGLLAALVGIGAAALYALQRLLASEEERFP